MKLMLLAIGKTDSKALDELIQQYVARLGHYVSCSLKIIPDVKRGANTSEREQREREGEAILSALAPTDRLILLDERGQSYTSREFAAHLEHFMLHGERRVVLAIGGPYGFSEAVYARAQELMSLSRLTFSHQMVRLFIAEQLYRAMTILRGEPYHHD